MKKILLLGVSAITLLNLTSCGNRSSIYEDKGPTINSQGLKGDAVASEVAGANFVCDRFSKDGCIDQVLMMGKLNRGKLQTCAAFFVGDNLIATAKKCLPSRQKDQSYSDWLDSACSEIAFKDLKGFTYTCSSIENQKYSEIVLVSTKQKSKVGFLETTNQGINFGGENKIFELTSFKRGFEVNYAVSEGKYTRAKKKCNGLKDSLLTTINGSKDSKNFVLSNCAIDWNSTGSPVLVDGKVAGMLHGKIEGDADFGTKVSDRDGVALAENFACQTKFYAETPAACDLHKLGDKISSLKNTLKSTLVNNGTAFDTVTQDITIFRKDSNLMVLATEKATTCATEGEKGSFQACKVNLPLKNKFLSTLDLANVALDCDNAVTTNWKTIKVDEKLTRQFSFEDYTLDGYHADRFWVEVPACE
ncbi:hypothetical protein ABMA79_01375 [Halobacteriovorax sp. HFRX-2_2]|uniref:hypothetical protein n=1 Tax=unclassified Halobacteriovorax TaxID=2639665 RepID=UPI00371FA611